MSRWARRGVPVAALLTFACTSPEDESPDPEGSGSSGNGTGGAQAPGVGGELDGASGGGPTGETGGSGGTPDPASGGNGTGGEVATGGTTATGGADGSGGAATLGCAGADYLICEDFEAADVGGTPAGWSKHGDASQVTDSVANTGSQSLELGAIPVWERRIYRDASMLGSEHWGRIYYRVEQPVPDAFVHSTLVALQGVGPTVGAAEYRVVDTVKRAVDFVVADQAGKHQFLYNVQIQGGPEFGEGTSYLWWFEDVWHCAEWHINAENQSYELFIDRESVLAFERGAGNYEGSEIPDSFSELRIGWINYQESPPGFRAWIDDVALDDERIGCF